MEFDLGRLLTEESKRMMNCLHEGIFIADKMGNIVFANQALLEGGWYGRICAIFECF